MPVHPSASQCPVAARPTPSACICQVTFQPMGNCPVQQCTQLRAGTTIFSCLSQHTFTFRCHQLLAALNWCWLQSHQLVAPGTVPVSLSGLVWARDLSSRDKSRIGLSMVRTAVRKKTMSLIHPAFAAGRATSSLEPTGSHPKAA